MAQHRPDPERLEPGSGVPPLDARDIGDPDAPTDEEAGIQEADPGAGVRVEKQRVRGQDAAPDGTV
jgi:hypothetical protein